MHRTELRVAAVAALFALLATLGPATAAWASHDPSPPYVASSQPGGYELYGFHHKAMSATVNCWIGLQRRGGDGWYRLWAKCDGDSRQGAATFAGSLFVEGANSYGPVTVTKGPSAGPLYYVGAWHPVQDLAYVSTSVTFRYTGGASVGPKCLESYIIRRGQQAAYAAPRSGC